MPKGQDSAIPTFDPTKGPKQFYLSREWRDAQRDFAQQKGGLGRQLVENPGLGKGLKDGVDYILETKKPDIEAKFGKGSADWLKGNLDALTPQELYQFYNMFSNLPRPSINPTPIPHTGEQIRTTQPIIGRQG